VSTKNIGFGVAPNVPFGIVNLIRPTEGYADTDIRSESGFVVTGGLRFVRMGAHITASYWSTNNDDAALPRKRVMYDINMGMALNRLILNGDIMNIKRTEGTTNEVMLLTAEAKYRVWREFYLQAGYTVANSAVARNTVGQFPTEIGPGSGNEIAFGTKAFLISGVEMETLFTSKENKEDGFAAEKEDTLQVQLHAYF
ncbi:MAG: hypothetical protein HRT44_01555, partial [Bdellovibrionales bacterium]|nr:hypothetical protein [Bdellovibrionales bacterium]NQZ17932.1 hypothetical protein [Bdellovibrionales bacterium]